MKHTPTYSTRRQRIIDTLEEIRVGLDMFDAQAARHPGDRAYTDTLDRVIASLDLIKGEICTREAARRLAEIVGPLACTSCSGLGFGWGGKECERCRGIGWLCRSCAKPYGKGALCDGCL